MEAGQTIQIGKTSYTMEVMPGTPDIVYAMSGRAGTVYKVRDGFAKPWALKAFHGNHRDPGQVAIARSLQPLASFQCLEVCRRTVLTPAEHRDLLKENPELIYSVLMPWMEGLNWTEWIFTRKEITAPQSLRLANELARHLIELEQNSIAHCDLSGGNLIVKEDLDVTLVDVEEVFSPGLIRPKLVPAGSPGYGPGHLRDTFWCPEADRLSGSILLAEILGWCDERVRWESAEESYFLEDEVQQLSTRFTTLLQVLTERWGRPVAHLLEQAWQAQSLAECPSFGDWSLALPDQVQSAAPASGPATTQQAGPEKSEPQRGAAQPLSISHGQSGLIVERAKGLLAQGKRESALELLAIAHDHLRRDDPLTVEVELLLKKASQVAPKPGSPARSEPQPKAPKLEPPPVDPAKHPGLMPIMPMVLGLLAVLGLILLGWKFLLAGHKSGSPQPTSSSNSTFPPVASPTSPPPNPASPVSQEARLTITGSFEKLMIDGQAALFGENLLSPGQHHIEARKNHCAPSIVDLSLQAGEKRTIGPLIPLANEFKVSFDTEPPETHWLLTRVSDGKKSFFPIGQQKSVWLAGGNYRVRFERDGYDAVERDFKVGPNASKLELVELPVSRPVNIPGPGPDPGPQPLPEPTEG